MDGGGTVDAEEFLVEVGTVPFVLLESVVRICFCELFHEGITTHFREDGSGLDFRNEGVSSDDVLDFSLFDILESVIIPTVYPYESEIISYPRKHLFQRFLHSQAVRFANPDLVNDLRTDDPDSAEAEPLFHRILEHPKNLPPLLGREFLGIIEQGRKIVFHSRSKSACSSDDRTGPGTAPGFIDSEEERIGHILNFYLHISALG